MLYFFQNLPWLIANRRKYPGLLKAMFLHAATGNYYRPV